MKLWKLPHGIAKNTTNAEKIVNHLIIHWLNATIGQQAFNLLAVEVGHANALHQTQIDQPLHGLPRIQVVDVAVRRWFENG